MSRNASYVLEPNLLSLLQLIEPPQIHWLLKQWLDVRVEGLPVGVLEMVFLATFMFVALYDSKGPFVLMILHHEPRDGLVIFAVYIASFDELVVQFGDGLGGVSGVQVNYDSVNHI